MDGMKASSRVAALSNAQIAELLTRAAETADGQKFDVKADGRIAVDLSAAPRMFFSFLCASCC